MSTPSPTIQIPTDPHQRRKWVIYQLHTRGRSLSAIARDLGIDRRATSLALVRSARRVEAAIAAELGLTARQLFPERFDEEGRRLRQPYWRRAPGPAA